MDFYIHLTDSEVEVLKAVAEASGDSLDQYLHDCVMEEIRADVDCFFGNSKAIKEKLVKKLLAQ
jgi:hypothetical protein